LARVYQRINSVSEFIEMKIIDILNVDELHLINPTLPLLVTRGALITAGQWLQIVNSHNNIIVVEWHSETETDKYRANLIASKFKFTQNEIPGDTTIILRTTTTCETPNCPAHKNNYSFGCYTLDLEGSTTGDTLNVVSDVGQVVQSIVSLTTMVVSIITNPFSLFLLPDFLLGQVSKFTIMANKYDVNPSNDIITGVTIKECNGILDSKPVYVKYPLLKDKQIIVYHGITGCGKTHTVCSLLGVSRQPIVYMNVNIVKMKPDKFINNSSKQHLAYRKATVSHLNKFNLIIQDIVKPQEEYIHKQAILLLDDAHLLNKCEFLSAISHHIGDVYITYGTDQHGNLDRLLEIVDGFKNVGCNIQLIEITDSYLMRKVIKLDINSDLCGTPYCVLHKTTSGIACYDQDCVVRNPSRSLDNSLTIKWVNAIADNLAGLLVKSRSLSNNANELNN